MTTYKLSDSIQKKVGNSNSSVIIKLCVIKIVNITSYLKIAKICSTSTVIIIYFNIDIINIIHTQGNKMCETHVSFLVTCTCRQRYANHILII
jgi:hypothetical protein